MDKPAASSGDGVGSVSEALTTSGVTTAAALFTPYGAVRSTTGTLPTSKGFTGQRADATIGLDYYHARYDDAQLGQFTSADSAGKGGLNRYGYVLGNPETYTDPSGHMQCATCGGGGGGGDNPPPPPSGNGGPGNGGPGNGGPCITDNNCPTNPPSGGTPPPGGGCGGCKTATTGGQLSSSQNKAGGSPAEDSYGCTPGDKICDDQKITGNTGWLLTYAAAGVTALVALLTAFAAFLTTSAAAAIASVLGIGDGVVLGELAAQVGVVAGLLAALGVEIGIVATMFAQQSGNTNAQSWSQAHLDSFRTSILGVVGTFTGIFGGIFALVSKAASSIPGSQIAVWGAMLGSAIGVVGSVEIQNISLDAISQIDGVMGY